MVSGTHRCNSSSHSPCTGTSSSCSGNIEPYRISDLAHSTTSIYQKTTEILFQAFENSYFIQLHGFQKQSTDPYVILSNGTQVTPSPDYLSTFKDKLYEADTTLTFRVAHIDTAWTRLRGFWNTQGRLINSSSNICSENASQSNGRFFHIEQERTKLRDNSLGWDKIAYAINNTFPTGEIGIDTITWTGSESESWFDSNNWDQNRIPSACKHVVIPDDTPFQLIIDEGIAVCYSMHINSLTATVTILPGSQLIIVNSNP